MICGVFPLQDSTVVFQAEEEGGETEDDGAVDLEYVAVDALENHTATIIWLHGHGDTAEHFEEVSVFSHRLHHQIACHAWYITPKRFLTPQTLDPNTKRQEPRKEF